MVDTADFRESADRGVQTSARRYELQRSVAGSQAFSLPVVSVTSGSTKARTSASSSLHEVGGTRWYAMRLSIAV